VSETHAAASRVLALLDDAAAGAAALELSSALAQALRRELAVVYVQSARSLDAAGLPITQVLSHAAQSWRAFSTQDVERGFRVHEARLREMAARIALRHAVNWSLQVMRGSLAGAATDLWTETDLLLLMAGSPAPALPAFGPAHKSRRRPVVAVVSEGSAAGERAQRVAAQLAQALAGVVESARVDAAAQLLGRAGALASLACCEVLVLPRAPLEPGALGRLRGPVLLVG
jgi:hypothetical protein